MINAIHNSAAEVWYVVGAICIAAGGKIMLMPKRSIVWLGIFLILFGLGICIEGFRYSHEVLGHIVPPQTG